LEPGKSEKVGGNNGGHCEKIANLCQKSNLSKRNAKGLFRKVCQKEKVVGTEAERSNGIPGRREVRIKRQSEPSCRNRAVGKDR